MTADIRTAAQREAETLYPYMPAELELHAINRSRRLRQKAFNKGAVWAAARVTPTREQIAAVLRRHNFDELLLGNIEWDGYTAVCACGWSSEECKMPGDAHEAHSEHAAAHVLALMAELAEGTV